MGEGADALGPLVAFLFEKGPVGIMALAAGYLWWQERKESKAKDLKIEALLKAQNEELKVMLKVAESAVDLANAKHTELLRESHGRPKPKRRSE